MESHKKFDLLRNTIYFSISVLLFFSGVILYGIILNIREVTLDEAIMQNNIGNIVNPKIVVTLNNHRLNLYSNDKFVKSYKAAFGLNQKKIRKRGEDNVTPVGIYNICEISDSEDFYKFIKINYPNKNDATNALKLGIISPSEYSKIVKAFLEGECITDSTALSANIGIHGIGDKNYIFKNLPFAFNWTNGSIAVSNESMDELISVVNIGTVVEVIR